MITIPLIDDGCCPTV